MNKSRDVKIHEAREIGADDALPESVTCPCGRVMQIPLAFVSMVNKQGSKIFCGQCEQKEVGYVFKESTK